MNEMGNRILINPTKIFMQTSVGIHCTVTIHFWMDTPLYTHREYLRENHLKFRLLIIHTYNE